MRILFLDHPECDYQAALVYSALCDVYGPESVVDFPYKFSYHGQVHRYPSIYATDPGATGTESWKDGDPPMGETAPLPWMRARQAVEWPFSSIVRSITSFDLVILASPRKNNTEALDHIIAATGRDAIKKLVIIDGEDYAAIRWDYIEKYVPDVYFKREMVESPQLIYPAERQRMEGRVKIVPLPLMPPAVVRKKPDAAANTDVVMFGGSNTPGGIEQWGRAVASLGVTFQIGYAPYAVFTECVARARIAVAPKGASEDSLRSWEYLGIEGPLVGIHRHKLIRPQPFVDGEHVFEFSSPDELQTQIRKYLADEPLRACVAAQGFQHTLQYHSAEARVAYIVKEVGL